MIYQALLMMLSLSVYLIANVVIVCGKYDKKQDWILVYQIAIFLAIFPQLAYIFFCHQRSFQRMQINFEEAEDINDTRSKNTGLQSSGRATGEFTNQTHEESGLLMDYVQEPTMTTVEGGGADFYSNCNDNKNSM